MRNPRRKSTTQRRYNVINGLYLEERITEYGELLLETTNNGVEVGRNLLLPSDIKTKNIPMKELSNDFNTIYFPVMENVLHRPIALDYLDEFNVQNIVMDVKLVDEHTVHLPNLTILADANNIGLQAHNIINKRETKFNKVILYSKSKVNWNDIIYDWRGRTNYLRIIMTEEDIYESNSKQPYRNLADILPNPELGIHFRRLEIEIHASNEKRDMGFEETLDELLDNDNKDKIIKDTQWKEVVDTLKRFTKNIYYTNPDFDELITKYNYYDDFQSEDPIILIVERSTLSNPTVGITIGNTSNVTFDINVDKIFESINKYRLTHNKL